MQYARSTDNTLVYPQPGEFPNIPNALSNDALLRRSGYLPLVGEPESREGFTASPARWHMVEQTETRTEPRQAFEDVVQALPVEGAPEGEEPQTELRVVGQRMVMVDTEVKADTSYIQVDEWSYEAVPEPPPAVLPPARYSKYKIQLATQSRGLWEQVKSAIASAGLQDSWANIMDIASDNPELQAALPAIREAFGSDTVDAVLEEAEI